MGDDNERASHDSGAANTGDAAANDLGGAGWGEGTYERAEFKDA